MNNEDENKLMDQKESAKLLGISSRTLEKWRMSKGKGPQYIQISTRCIRYRKKDLINFITTRIKSFTG